MRLMIVDDHAGVRKLIRQLAAGPEDIVCECASGNEAMRQAQNFKPDAITMDMRMPGICSFEAIRAIRVNFPAARIVIVTSYDEPFLRRMASETGVVAFLTKENLSGLRDALTDSLKKADAKSVLEPAHSQNPQVNAQSSQHLRVLLENSQDVLVEITRDGQILYVSPNVKRILGYEPEDVLGTNVFERVHPDDLPQAYSQLGLPECWATCRYQHQDGSWRWVETTGRDFELAEGTPRSVLIVRDITDRKHAEQALRESEEKFSKAFLASPGAMGISDVESRRFIEVNDGYLKMFGYTREEFLGHSSMTLGLWECETERHHVFETFFKQGFVRNVEVHGRTKGGERIICLLSAESIELKGRKCVVTTLHDITSRRRAEEERASLEVQLRQAQKMEAVGTLAGGIAHDFNNILAAIIAYTELAKMENDLSNELCSYLTQVSLASNRAKDLVRQILTFSRQQKQERKPMRLQPIIKEALKLMRSTLPSTIEIEANIDPKAPAVMADSTQIHQVVVNLCTNAAHAMRGEPGRLGVHFQDCQVDETFANTVPELRPGRYVKLSISDTGHGIEPQILKRIFEPFFTTKAPGEGTGLGLPVVHGIVREHEGAITIKSQPGEGATFDVYLPALVMESNEKPSDSKSMPLGNGQQILFVDDEAAICTSMSMIFNRLGYRVVTHTNPAEALAEFRQCPDQFELVIADLTMPGMTGVELARRVLTARPQIPVVLTTGFSGTLTQEQAKAVGIHSILMKPFTVTVLAESLHAALEENNQRN